MVISDYFQFPKLAYNSQQMSFDGARPVIGHAQSRTHIMDYQRQHICIHVFYLKKYIKNL